MQGPRLRCLTSWFATPCACYGGWPPGAPSAMHLHSPFQCAAARTCSKATSESWGPGDASGWLCTVMALRPGCSMPAHVPSFRLIRLTCGEGVLFQRVFQAVFKTVFQRVLQSGSSGGSFKVQAAEEVSKCGQRGGIKVRAGVQHGTGDAPWTTFCPGRAI